MLNPFWPYSFYSVSVIIFNCDQFFRSRLLVKVDPDKYNGRTGFRYVLFSDNCTEICMLSNYQFFYKWKITHMNPEFKYVTISSQRSTFGEEFNHHRNVNSERKKITVTVRTTIPWHRIAILKHNRRTKPYQLM